MSGPLPVTSCLAVIPGMMTQVKITSNTMDDAHETVQHNIRTASDYMKVTYEVETRNYWQGPYELSTRPTSSRRPEEGTWHISHPRAKARFGVIREKYRDLFTVSDEDSLHTWVCPESPRPSKTFSVKLKQQDGRVGQTLKLRRDHMRVLTFFLKKSYQIPIYRTVWEMLLILRES